MPVTASASAVRSASLATFAVGMPSSCGSHGRAQALVAAAHTQVREWVEVVLRVIAGAPLVKRRGCPFHVCKLRELFGEVAVWTVRRS